MNGAKQLFVGTLLSLGLLSGAHAVYVGGNPLSYVDPKGLDVVVVTGGYRGGANVFGHTGMGVTGNGMYSYGNDTPLGSSVADYLRDQSQYRDQVITFIPTSPTQDAAAARFFTSKPGKNSVGYFDNCAVRTNQGLEAAGLPTNGIPFPGGVSRDAASFPGATTYFIPKGGPIPPDVARRLPAFNGGTP